MRYIKKLLTALLLLLLPVLALQQAALVSFLYPTVSLRYEEPISREQAERAKKYTKKTGGPTLTFWSEGSAAVQGSTVRQITFDGDGSLACPVEYCHGQAPVAGETETCAVSTGLAWQVWGAENAVGLELTVGDETCRVTGVFREEEPVLLRPDTGDFTAVELESIPQREDSYRYAEGIAWACGLGGPDEILWGPGFAGWMWLLSWIPVLLLAAPLAGYALKKYRRIPAFWRGVLLWGLAFAVALALPWLLEAVPPWLLPTRWSDFGFWTRLWDTLADRWVDLFALEPRSRDVRAKLAMVKTVCCTLAACGVIKVKPK